MENKNEGNENKIIHEYFNCTKDKIKGMLKIKHKLYRSCFNDAL